MLADRSGLDLTRLFDRLAGGYADSAVLRSRGERIINRDYRPLSRARYLAKDLGFASEVAQSTHTRPVLLPAVAEVFAELIADGHGDQDISVTRQLTEDRTGEPDASTPDHAGG